MQKNSLIMAAIVALVFGVGGFVGGVKYQDSRRPGSSRQFGGNGRNGQPPGASGRNGFRPTAGEIINSDATSITIKLQDGSTKIVLITDTTTINKATPGVKADLKTGERVAVFGTDNSDGSVTAQTLQLNPLLGGMGGRKNQAEKSPDAKEVIVEGSNFQFSPNQITVKKGEKTRIVFKNKDGMHDFRIDQLSIKTAVINAGEEDFVEFTPDKTGSFEFYCSVANHKTMGMKGTLVVE